MLNEEKLTVYFADDHEIVAKAIAQLLASIPTVGQVTTFLNGKLLYEACIPNPPDLVILDMEMPEWNGMATLKKLRELYTLPVIMLSMNDEKTMITESIKAGANGYLNKNCSVKELQLAVETVLNGQIFLSEEIQKIMIGLVPHHYPEMKLSEPLTEKEYEVLKLVCDGLSSKEIGEKLFISPRTVETRKNNLMEKFNVQTTGKLISIAIKNKMV